MPGRLKFRDRAPIINPDRIREWKEKKAAEAVAKQDRKKRKARRKRERLARQQATNDQLFERIRTEAIARGISLRQGTARFPIHWMFEDAVTGARILNYYPRSQTGCYAKGKGFRVGDADAALDVASKCEAPAAPCVKKPDGPKPKKEKKGPTPPKTSGWKNYRAYQRSTVWAAKRDAALEIHGNKCCKCGSTEKLCVIRLTYMKKYGTEDPATDLEIKCRACWDEENHRGSDALSARYREIVRNLKPSPSAPSPA